MDKYKYILAMIIALNWGGRSYSSTTKSTMVDFVFRLRNDEIPMAHIYENKFI